MVRDFQEPGGVELRNVNMVNFSHGFNHVINKHTAGSLMLIICRDGRTIYITNVFHVDSIVEGVGPFDFCGYVNRCIRGFNYSNLKMVSCYLNNLRWEMLY